MTDAERAAALAAIASEVRACTKCRLHEGRTTAVPGEGSASSDVVFIGEGPGATEDREGLPFVGRAGGFLAELLRSIGWSRQEVFITNIVKCRPPENRDPEPDEVEACAPYLRRQLATLDPALVVTLGRHSMGRFMPGAMISRVHGTTVPVDPAAGPTAALAFAMYHPAAALRTPAVAEQSFADIAGVPAALERARAERATRAGARPGQETAGDRAATQGAAPGHVATSGGVATPGLDPSGDPADQLTLFR